MVWNCHKKLKVSGRRFLRYLKSFICSLYMEPRLYPKSLRKYTEADIGITRTTTSKAFESGMETVYFSTTTLSRHLTNYVR